MRNVLKCPWRDFQDCLKLECPFYGVILQKWLQGEWFNEYGCLRVQQMLREQQ